MGVVTGDARHRYAHDPVFHQVVKSMRVILARGQLTPHDMVQAAALACEAHELDEKAAGRR